MTAYIPFTRPEIDEATIAGGRRGAALGLDHVRARRCSASKRRSRATAAAGRCACFNSGTAALEIALRLAGVGPGDEVITTGADLRRDAPTWSCEVGARPVFVDVDLDTRNIDLARIEAAITPRTRAIMPVHLAGLPVDLRPALRARRGGASCA